MKRLLILICLSLCGLSCGREDLCGGLKNELGHAQRDAEMWEQMADSWRNSYNDKDCSCQ